AAGRDLTDEAPGSDLEGRDAVRADGAHQARAGDQEEDRKERRGGEEAGPPEEPEARKPHGPPAAPEEPPGTSRRSTGLTRSRSLRPERTSTWRRLLRPRRSGRSVHRNARRAQATGPSSRRNTASRGTSSRAPMRPVSTSPRKRIDGRIRVGSVRVRLTSTL